MSADESFSSSDESNTGSSSTTSQHRRQSHRKQSNHLTGNHRLVQDDQQDLNLQNQNQIIIDAENDQLFNDFYPLIVDDPNQENIDDPSLLKLFSWKNKNRRTNPEEFWLVFKAYFAIFFLMFALLALFFLYFQHLTLATNTTTDHSAINNDLFNQSKAQINQINLDHQDHYHLFWLNDFKHQSILFQLKLNNFNNFDWFAFGFSSNGSIYNSDLCLIWFGRRRKSSSKPLSLHLEDVQTDSNGLIHLDRNSNDCHLIKWKFNRSKRLLLVSFRRYFDTCDPDDYIIDNGTTHLVYAKGNGPLSTVDDLNLLKNSVEQGFQRVQLLKPPPLPSSSNYPLLVDDNIQQLDLIVENVTIPNVETTYWCQLRKLPEKFRNKIHIVRYEAIIPESSKHLVHHMELFHCQVDSKLILPEGWNGSCQDPQMPPDLNQCKRVVAAWAYGAGPMTYPDHVGLPIGGENYSLYLMIEVHYNNPDLIPNLQDSSGIRIYFQENLRPMDAGILEIGLEYSEKNSIPPNVLMELRGYCHSECTRIGLPPQGIEIFASQLHTHLTGIQTWTEHFRGQNFLQELNRDNHYSPHFQEIRKLPQPVRIIPGDTLVHVCRYDTRTRTSMTLGGLGIQNEMCVNYLHYYPSSNLEVCKSSIDTSTLFQWFDLMHSEEKQNTSSEKFSIIENFENIHWTPLRSKKLNELYLKSPLSIQCNKSSGERFPGYWNGIPLTVIGRNSTQQQQNESNNNSRCRWVMKKLPLEDIDDDPNEEDDEDDEIGSDYKDDDDDYWYQQHHSHQQQYQYHHLRKKIKPWTRSIDDPIGKLETLHHHNENNPDDNVSKYQYLLDHAMDGVMNQYNHQKTLNTVSKDVSNTTKTNSI